MIPIIETYSPFREALRGLQVRMPRRIQKRKWSIVVIGDAGVGKTLLVELLTGNETNLTVSTASCMSCIFPMF
jgi:putative ribosome biogenesis GTPase RsgA